MTYIVLEVQTRRVAWGEREAPDNVELLFAESTGLSSMIRGGRKNEPLDEYWQKRI